MKKIPLDRDKKLMLIRWLQQNHADTDELRALEDLHHYTKEELDRHELDLYLSLYPDECELIRENGDCYPLLEIKPQDTKLIDL